MADTKKLQSMLDNLINNNTEQAQVDFHDYLGDKTKEVLNISSSVEVADDTDTDFEAEEE